MKKNRKKVKRVIFVAPWFNLTDEVMGSQEEAEIARSWMDTPIDFEEIKRNDFVAVFSDDDPYVPITDKDLFEERLNAKTVVLKNKGHISEEENITELPEILGFIN